MYIHNMYIIICIILLSRALSLCDLSITSLNDPAQPDSHISPVMTLITLFVASADMVDHAKKQMTYAIVWLLTFAIITGASFNLLLSTDPADEDLQVIPVLSIVGFGIGITAIGFTYLRYQAAHELALHKPEMETLNKLYEKRVQLEKLSSFEVSMKAGLNWGIEPVVAGTAFPSLEQGVEMEKVVSTDDISADQKETEGEKAVDAPDASAAPDSPDANADSYTANKQD